MGINFDTLDDEDELNPVAAPVPPKPDPIAYVKQKYGIGVQPQQQQVEPPSELGGQVSGALASLGAAFQGKDSFAAVNQAMANHRDAVKRSRESDPNSEESMFAKEAAKRMGYKGDVSGLTAEKFKSISPVMEKMYDIEQKKLDRQESRDERRFQQGIKMDERKERNMDTDIQKLSKDVAGTQEMLGALDEVEGKLGSSLEKYKKDKDGNLTLDGKPVDLPGVSIPGIGRVTSYDSDARELQGAASRVFNATLKDRSGGAVTDSEMERLRREFNQGKYNTEPELIDALQRFKRQTATVLKNREAGYKPEVVDKYADQGGRTSRSLKTDTGKTVVKTQTNQKTGAKRIVYSDGSIEEIPATKVAGGN